jgi:CBS domain-containing protein
MAAAPSVFRERVHELVRRPPVTCAPGATAAEAARRMSAERVGSVVGVVARLAVERHGRGHADVCRSSVWPTVSVGPPAENGTMIVTTFDG